MSAVNNKTLQAEITKRGITPSSAVSEHYLHDFGGAEESDGETVVEVHGPASKETGHHPVNGFILLPQPPQAAVHTLQHPHTHHHHRRRRSSSVI